MKEEKVLLIVIGLYLVLLVLGVFGFGVLHRNEIDILRNAFKCVFSHYPKNFSYDCVLINLECRFCNA